MRRAEGRLRPRRRRGPGYRIAWLVAAALGVPYFRPRVEGLANVCRDRPFIVACNHLTLLDWAALAYFIPRPVRFLITRAYYDRPALRWFCRLGGAIPVRPGKIETAAVRRALAALGAGDAVGIFPEGRLSPDGNVLPARRGVVELAVRAGVSIVPATIRGAARAFPRNARVPRPYRVTVVFDRAVMPPRDCVDRAAQEAFARDLMRRITALGDASRLRAARPQETPP